MGFCHAMLIKRGGPLALLVGAALLVAACEPTTVPTQGPSSSSASVASPAATKDDFGIKGVEQARRVLDPPRQSSGKPLTFFLGGQFCPFCAAMRWPFVQALGRFGTWSDLGEMRSRPGEDGFSSLATYDLVRAAYKSDYLTLHVVEVADAQGNPLQQPSPEDKPLVDRFDPTGSIPFVLVGGAYSVQLPYSPGVLEGRKYADMTADLASTNPGLFGQVVNGEADALTALICKTDGSRPEGVCGTARVQALMQRAP